MKIVIAPDSFKGSLSAGSVAQAIAAGVSAAVPTAEIVVLPVADGGEGTVDAILLARDGMKIDCDVYGPLGGRISASFGLLAGGETAVVEMAQAAGLNLISADLKNPRRTSTYGVGELIVAALSSGAKRIILGIGGSCTNDGGAGAMQAMGAQFYALDGSLMTSAITGADLSKIDSIDLTAFALPGVGVKFVVASDVNNPLVGPQGAAHVYGPQKGATPEMVEELDASLTHFAEVIHRDLGIDVANMEGAGAAGGLGGALMAFLGAEMQSGIDLVLDTIGFDDALVGANLVITGEGRIDAQTLQGKVVHGVLARSNRLGVPVVALAGAVDPQAEQDLEQMGLIAAVPVVNRCMTLSEAIDNASDLLENATVRCLRLFMHV